MNAPPSRLLALGARRAVQSDGSPRTLLALPCRCLRCATCSLCCCAAWSGCLFIGLLVALAAIIPILLSYRPWIDDDPTLDFGVNGDVGAPFVSAAWLEEHLAAGNVTVLDARPPPTAFTTAPGLDRMIPGAQRAQWGEFLDKDALKPPAEVAAIYRAKGVSGSRPVVVYGGWSEKNSWGEEVSHSSIGQRHCKPCCNPHNNKLLARLGLFCYGHVQGLCAGADLVAAPLAEPSAGVHLVWRRLGVVRQRRRAHPPARFAIRLSSLSMCVMLLRSMYASLRCVCR